MKYSLELIKAMQRQLAYIVACYGDYPEELMYKLESLILEWYEKGRNSK